MNIRTYTHFCRWGVFTPLLAFCLLALPRAAGQDDEEGIEIFELSPFAVDASDQSGYRAVNTLAGTRIKTELKDLGSAISVVTKDFLEDTGTTSVEDLLVYTTSTEVGGAYGNFAGPGAAVGDTNANNNARADPASNTRVRGLSKASQTRDYFLSAMGFDGYNTEMVTISRGPNSILFGIGEPGGIIDNTLKKAVLGRNFNTVSARYGSHGTYRGTIDLNRVIVEDRLAVRVNAMHENITFKQRPAFEEDTRYYIATKAVLSKNENNDFLGQTVLRANWERVEIRGTPPDPIPPKDHYSSWWYAPGSSLADAITGVKPNGGWPDDWRNNYASPQWLKNQIFPGEEDPGLEYTSQPGIWNSYAIVWGNPTGAADVGFPSGADWTGNDWSGTQVIHATAGSYTIDDGSEDGVQTPGWFPLFSSHQGGNHRFYGNGFRDHVIMDTSIHDHENLLLQGTSQFSNHDLDAHNFALEQTFLDGRAGIELAVDSQEYQNSRFFPFGRAQYAAVRIDTATYLPNGAENPNVGRPMMSGQWDPVNHRWLDYDTQRATAYYELDFTKSDDWTRHFGKHTFTGLYSKWERDERNYGQAVSWDTAHDADQNYRTIINRPGAWGGRMFAIAYVGDAQFGAATPSDMRLYTEPLDIQVPQVGEFYNNYYWDREDGVIRQSTARVRSLDLWPGRTRQEVDSQAFTVQSRFLDNHLVTTYGTRTDDSRTWQVERIGNPDGSFQVEESWDNWIHGDTGEFRSYAAGPDPVLDTSGDTNTLQAVLHVPLGWTTNLPGSPTFSLHWSESENFNPANVRRDIYNQVIGPPSGETTEKGFSVGLFENRLNMRFNWYETSSNNVTNTNITGSLWQFADIAHFYASRWMNAKNGWLSNDQPSFEDIVFGNPNQDGYPFEADPTLIGDFESYDEVIDAFINQLLPASTREAVNYRIIGEEGNQVIEKDSIQGISSVADVVSEGFEVEATYNINNNWRVAFNVAKSESIFSNGLQQLTPYAESLTERMQSLGLWDISRGGWTETSRVSENWVNGALTSLASAQSKEGTVNTELRKWRWNAITNYTFSEGRFKGLGAGAAARWQDAAAVGYPLERNDLGLLVPVLDSPFFGGEDFSGDVWFSYKTNFFNDSLPVKFQLNLVNALGTDEPQVVTKNPDGRTAIIRNPAEKRWFFTTTIDF